MDTSRSPSPPEGDQAILRIGRGDWIEQRWRNGQGLSWAIVDGAQVGLAGLQIFRTPITQPAPFSDYAGRDRIFTVVGGSGVQLIIDSARQDAAPLEPVRFSGEAEVSVALPGGAVEVFNVIYARDLWREVDAPGAGVLVIRHALSDHADIAADETVIMSADTAGPLQDGVLQFWMERQN